MSGCCDEPGCRRSQPIKILRSGLSGRWYVVTRWKDKGNGVIVAFEKHLAAPDLSELLDDRYPVRESD